MRLYKILIFSILFYNIGFGQKVDSVIYKSGINEKSTPFEIEQSLGKNKNDTTFLKAIIEKSPIRSLKIGVLNLLGISARNNSQYLKSLKYHKQAFEESDKAKLTEHKAFSLNMIGVAYRRIDNIKDALENHNAALQILENLKPESESILRNTAISLNSIGNIFLSLKQYDLAQKNFEKSLEIEKKVKNTLGLAINNQNLGYISEAKNDFKTALNYYKISLKYNKEIESKLGIVICNNSIAQVLLKQNKTLDAQSYIEPSLKLAEDLGDDYYKTLTKTNAGWIYSNLNQNEKAVKFLNEALILADKNKLISSQEEIHKQFANHYELNNEPEKSLFHLRKQQFYAQEVLNESNLKFTSELLQKYDSEKKETQISLLEKENELVKYKLARNSAITIFSVVLMVLLGLVMYNLYRNWQIRSQRKVLVLEQQMLRSQMNPHFLFNSLNSIKLYIINNEKEKAVFYLNKFSKLMRNILNNSQEKEISLKEELDITELYMNLENIRFDEQINFNIIHDKNLNLEFIKVPSLILQPFVENAIWHGLSNKSGDKNLKINILKISEKSIGIEIIDNGIGRLKAAEIKAQKISKQQESLGLKITKSRLENFAKNMNGEISIEFIDLIDSRNNALGTKVIISLPI